MDLIKHNINDKKIVRSNLYAKIHFFLGDDDDTCCIRILRRKTNIFLIVEDLNSKLITYITSGSAGIVGSKRRKREPFAMESIFKVLYPYLKIYDIQKVKIILNTRLNGCFYILMRELEHYGIVINSCIIQRRVAFNGCRGKKKRRT